MTAYAAHVAAVAEAMHDAYEDAARRVGWETNPASRVAWADLPAANKATMLAAVTVAVETLTPLIRAQVAAEIRAEAARLDALTITHQDRTSITILQIKREATVAAARIAEATP